MIVVDFSGRYRSGSVSKVVMVLVGVVGVVGIGGVVYVLWQIWFKDFLFEVIYIELSGFKVWWMMELLIFYVVVDVVMKIFIKVMNLNIMLIKYISIIMVMFYWGMKMGIVDVCNFDSFFFCF